MFKMFKKAFTLAEILIVVMIVGFIAMALIKALSNNSYTEKAMHANALKTITAIEQASAEIKDTEHTQVPTGAFMEYVTGQATYTTYNASGSAQATASDIVTLFSKHLKFEKEGINFCDYSSCSDASVKGAKMVGDVYIGFGNIAIANCPSYRLPNETTDSPAPTYLNPNTRNFETQKCWGKVYIDVNGKNGPNTQGKDIFIFGMGANGLAR